MKQPVISIDSALHFADEAYKNMTYGHPEKSTTGTRGGLHRYSLSYFHDQQKIILIAKIGYNTTLDNQK